MNKLDALIERLRALPESEQDLMASEIEQLFEPPLLSPEQSEELNRRLAAPDRDYMDHDAVEAFFVDAER